MPGGAPEGAPGGAPGGGQASGRRSRRFSGDLDQTKLLGQLLAPNKSFDARPPTFAEMPLRFSGSRRNRIKDHRSSSRRQGVQVLPTMRRREFNRTQSNQRNLESSGSRSVSASVKREEVRRDWKNASHVTGERVGEGQARGRRMVERRRRQRDRRAPSQQHYHVKLLVVVDYSIFSM